MGGENWNLTAKLCDSCKTASAAVFCGADTAFLCLDCDSEIHAANKLASRHARVWVCDVCEQAPANVTCKADAAALCVTCDRDIHSANPLARRHERLPVVPFYDSSSAVKPHSGGSDSVSSESGDKYFSNESDNHNPDTEEEAEAASWLLPNLNNFKGMDPEESEYLFGGMDPYLEIEMISGGGDLKPHRRNHHQHYDADGVVPEQKKNCTALVPGTVVDGFPAYEIDFAGGGSKQPFMYNFASQSISQSVSSSSLEVGVVPDNSATTDVSNVQFNRASGPTDAAPNPLSGVEREARVLRYREKRKNRKFEKTIRYASRKAYAETRPRIKGRFAKRSEIEVGPDVLGYGIVPSY